MNEQQVKARANRLEILKAAQGKHCPILAVKMVRPHLPATVADCARVWIRYHDGLVSGEAFLQAQSALLPAIRGDLPALTRAACEVVRWAFVVALGPGRGNDRGWFEHWRARFLLTLKAHRQHKRTRFLPSDILIPPTHPSPKE